MTEERKTNLSTDITFGTTRKRCSAWETGLSNIVSDNIIGRRPVKTNQIRPMFFFSSPERQRP